MSDVIDKDMGYADTMATLRKLARKRNGAHVKVGFFGDDRDTKLAVIKALANEHGVPEKNIPARPFFSQALDENAGEIMDAVQEVVADALDNNGRGQIDFVPGLVFAGELVQRKIKESIRTWTSPPNDLDTLKQKDGNQPLVDSGQMAAFVKVKEGR